MILYVGTNDITGGASAAQVIAGMQEIINRVHAKGVPIYGGTVVPRGRPAPLTGWTGPMEAVKLAINHWMHTDANFDGLVEFGALLAGPLVVGTDGAPAETMWDAWNCFDYRCSCQKASDAIQAYYMGTRTVRLDQEAERLLSEIRRQTGTTISGALKRGLEIAVRELRESDAARPFEVYQTLDLGPGGYSHAPGRRAK
ncbi:MAG TPA: hypothetical protein VE549_03765, partial [Myxococcaceae bacterium]|nr:hypothetical protein [Myxococcaceae bacterium]